MTEKDHPQDPAEESTPRAAQQAHGNARRSPSDYDDEGRPAASRSREHQDEPGRGPDDDG